MLFSSKALRVVVSASVASVLVAQTEACDPMTYVALLEDGVDCGAFDAALTTAGGVYVEEDGECSPIDDDDEYFMAYISICPDDIGSLESLALLGGKCYRLRLFHYTGFLLS